MKKLDMNKKIYFISDTHFGQWFANWFFGRPFKNLREMNERIIENWNNIVTNEDIVIIVGDFYSGSREFLIELVDSLNGEKILIKGNHDFSWRYKKLVEDGRIEVYDRLLLKGESLNILLTHIAVPVVPENTINIHGHYHRKLRPIELNNKHYYNVCVDHTDFSPVAIETILDYYNNTLEWYEPILNYLKQLKERKQLNYEFLLG